MHKKDYSSIAPYIIDTYKSGKSIRELTRQLHIGKEKIKEILQLNGLEIRPGYDDLYQSRKYTIQDDYFENINLSDKAYWLGFLSADGHLRENTGVSLHLKQSDATHLSKLLNSINSNSEIEYIKNTKSARIGLWSKKLAKDLFNLGFRHNKSQTQTFPNIPSEFYRDFIRGVLDGDGNIRYYNRRRTKKNGGFRISTEHTIRFCGTHDMVNNISEIICIELGCPKRNIYCCGEYFCEIKYDGRIQCNKILHWLYDEANTFLDRKRRIYEAIIAEII